MRRALLLSLLLVPSAVSAAEWMVVVGYVDHEPAAWDDAILAKGNALNADLAACGLDAFWDFAVKFDGFDTNGRGSVFVVNTPEPLSKAAAKALLARTRPCVPDAYVKSASHFGE